MKKLVLLIVTIVITLLVNKSWAQENDNNKESDSKQEKKDNRESDFRDKLIIGIKGGANLSNVYDTKGEDFQADPKYGFVGGGYVAIPIGTYFGVQPELLFSQKGFQATGKIIGQSYEFTRTTTFIDVPLLIAFKPSEFITILAGPQYSYLIKQKDVFTSSNSKVQVEQEFAHDDIRKNMLCFKGGVDFNFKQFVLGIRTGWDVLNNNGDGSTTTPRYKNVWYQATIGYTLYND